MHFGCFLAFIHLLYIDLYYVCLLLYTFLSSKLDEHSYSKCGVKTINQFFMISWWFLGDPRNKFLFGDDSLGTSLPASSWKHVRIIIRYTFFYPSSFWFVPPVHLRAASRHSLHAQAEDSCWCWCFFRDYPKIKCCPMSEHLISKFAEYMSIYTDIYVYN